MSVQGWTELVWTLQCAACCVQGATALRSLITRQQAESATQRALLTTSLPPADTWSQIEFLRAQCEGELGLESFKKAHALIAAATTPDDLSDGVCTLLRLKWRLLMIMDGTDLQMRTRHCLPSQEVAGMYLLACR